MTKSAHFLFIILGGIVSQFPLPVLAVTLDEMMKATNKQPPPISAGAKPSSATTPPASAPIPLQPSVSAATSSQSASIPAQGAAAKDSQKLPIEKGSCGLFGMYFGGCPQGGVIAPPHMPELTVALSSLTSLLDTSVATKEEGLALIHIANQLSKINPQALQAQLQALDKAAPAYQFGALKKLTLPESINTQTDLVALMKTLVNDAMSGGIKVELGVKQALTMLKAVHARSTDEDVKKSIAKQIGNLEKISQSRLISAAATQILKPFMDGNKMLRTNPMTHRPLTTPQIAIGVTLLSLEGNDSEEDFSPKAAKISHHRETSLDNL